MGSIRYWVIGLSILVIVLGLIGLSGSLKFGNPLMIFLPVAVLAIALVIPGFMRDPVTILAIFLLLVVNFNFVKIFGPLNLDVVASGILLWAVVVRLGLTKPRRLFRGSIEKIFIAFLVVSFISVLLSVSPVTSLKRWGRDLEYLMLFSFLLTVPLAAVHFKRITMATMLSTLIPCILGLIGLLFGVEALLGDETPLSESEVTVRIVSTLSHATIFSLYLGIMAVLTLSFLLDGRFFKRIWLLFLFLLQIVVMYLTFGRGGWGLFIVGVVTLFWLRGQRWLLIAGLPASFAAFLFLLPSFIDRWTMAAAGSNKANSLLWRFGLWAHTLERFPERPLFGSGPDTFIDYINFERGYAAHHGWLGLLIECGLVGLTAYALLVFFTIRTLVKKYRLTPPKSDPLIEAVIAIWVGMLVAAMIGDVWASPAICVYLWVLTAIALRKDSIFDPTNARQ
jgi:O-antigen ligase